MSDLRSNEPECAPVGSRTRWPRVRAWFQTGFLAVWLAPLAGLHGVPGCTFHCHSCPLSSFGCPVGLAANYAAGVPVWRSFPFLLVGVLAAVGGVVGSLVCGWACPFGFVQDLLAKITPRKLRIPNWLGWCRYAVLGGLVIALPWYLGAQGIPYDEQRVSICRLCPAGALEAGLPYSIQGLFTGQGWTMGPMKIAILAAFLVAAVLMLRPWCRIFCPLGGFLALFNRWSLFHLRYRAPACVECNTCRTRCPYGVKVDLKINTTGCIRCLECTNCGAIEPVLARPGARSEGAPVPPA